MYKCPECLENELVPIESEAYDRGEHGIYQNFKCNSCGVSFWEYFSEIEKFDFLTKLVDRYFKK